MLSSASVLGLETVVKVRHVCFRLVCSAVVRLAVARFVKSALDTADLCQRRLCDHASDATDASAVAATLLMCAAGAGVLLLVSLIHLLLLLLLLLLCFR